MDQDSSQLDVQPGQDVRGVRCFKCGKLLAKENEEQAALEIKCVRCGALNALFRGVTDQVIITDIDGVILYANSMVKSVTGYEISEILGKTPALWGKQMPIQFYQKMWYTIKQQKQPIIVKVTNRKKNGTLYDALLRISPVSNASGNVYMFVGIETVIA